VTAINPTDSGNIITFRWTYIVLPASILLVSLVLAAVFYSRLPEQVAYHFSGGLPDRWLGRAVFTGWTVAAQAILTLSAFVLVGMVLLGARRWSVESPTMKGLLPVMGNMVALPQLIILFTMLHVFLYNSYEIRLISVLAFSLIVLALGGAVLVVLIVQAARQARRSHSNKPPGVDYVK
jgi:uncharacterized membrane protein